VIGDRFTEAVPPARTPPSSPAPSAPTAALPAAVLPAYTGAYYSTEADATFTISARGGDLLLQRETDPAPIALTRGDRPDQFRARGLTIRFQWDTDRRIRGLSVDAGRVREITFQRR
jgi:hypothetical protein